MSGQGELDNLSLRCAEQESEVCMYTEGIEQIQGRIEVMKENEAVFPARAREFEAALAAFSVEEAVFRGTPDAAHKALCVVPLRSLSF